MGTQRTKTPIATMPERQRRTLRAIEATGGDVAVRELTYPRIALTLAQHGYIEMTARITDKGRQALERTRVQAEQEP